MHSRNLTVGIAIMAFLAAVAGCARNNRDNDPFQQDWRAWHAKRLQRLKAPDGWLSLAGLFWLKGPAQQMGSARNCDFPITHAAAPERIGTFAVQNGRVIFTPFPGVRVTREGRQVNGPVIMAADDTGAPTVLALDHFKWQIIRRGQRLGVRLRDSRHPRIARLEDIPAYPPDPRWHIKARFIPYPAPRKLTVPTVLGTMETETCPGELQFTVKGRPQRLLPVGDEATLFLVFGDRTNGSETYGGGRFLSVPPPDAEGNTVLDFNRATNPPCAFSPFATCPLPPPDNELSIPIPAGERKVPGFGHH